MHISQKFEYGTSVKIKYIDGNSVDKKVFAKIVCSNFKDSNIYSCITPHGSIIKIHYSNMYILSDDSEYLLMEEVEKDAFDKNRLLYNNLFNLPHNFGNE